MNYSDAADDKNAGVANYGALSGSQSMNRASSSHFHMNTSAGYSLIDRVTCAKSFERETWCVIGLCLFCFTVLFFGLGGAALFEPDEGRNAEVAREVLLLDGEVRIRSTARSPARMTVLCGLSEIKKNHGIREPRWFRHGDCPCTC